MTDATNSQSQQNAHAWKKLVDGQLDLMTSLHEHAAKLRDQGLDQSAFAFDELTRVTKESARHASELFAAQQRVDSWKSSLDKQVEQASGIAERLANMQGERIEHTRTMLSAFTNMTKSSLDHASKLSKAWQEVASEGAERVASWTDND